MISIFFLYPLKVPSSETASIVDVIQVGKGTDLPVFCLAIRCMLETEYSLHLNW